MVGVLGGLVVEVSHHFDGYDLVFHFQHQMSKIKVTAT